MARYMNNVSLVLESVVSIRNMTLISTCKHDSHCMVVFQVAI